MRTGNERKKIVKELLDVTDKEFTDEELIHDLIASIITMDIKKRVLNFKPKK